MKKLFSLTILLLSNSSFAYLLELPECKGKNFEWSDCYSLMENGGFYSGAWKEGIPHGRGYYELEDGSSYTGRFEEGSMYGHGSWRDSDGNTFTGFFENNLFHGNGLSIFEYT